MGYSGILNWIHPFPCETPVRFEMVIEGPAGVSAGKSRIADIVQAGAVGPSFSEIYMKLQPVMSTPYCGVLLVAEHAEL